MSVSLNAVMAAGNSGDTHTVSGATSLSTTGITVAAGANTILIVVLGWQGGSGDSNTPTGRSVTWNGVAMTEVAFADRGSSTNETVGIYVLVAPATGAQTLAASWTNSKDCYCSAIAFDGADQTTGINASDTVTDIADGLSIAVTGTSDGACVATHLRNGGQPTGAGTGNTLFWTEQALAPGGGGAYRIGLNGTNTFDFNSGSLGVNRVSAAVHVIAAAGGGASTPTEPWQKHGAMGIQLAA